MRSVPEIDRVLATVLFTDIVGSTECVVTLGDRAWGILMDTHNEIIRRELHQYRGREIRFTGDGPARAIYCASAIAHAIRSLGVEVRAGLHTGEIKLVGNDIGARVAERAGGSEVVVSSTVKDLVAGSGIRFTDRGVHVLKGVPGKWHLFAAKDPAAP